MYQHSHSSLKSFRWFLFLALFTLSSCSVVPTKWDVPPAEVVDLGDGTYSITRDARSVFSSVEGLEAQVRKDAADYCKTNHLEYDIVSIDSKDVSFFKNEGFSQTKLIFKAWPKNEGHYASPTPATYPNATPAPLGEPNESAVESGSPTDQMYNDLLKLDELLKKGILTEAEFAIEKQKVLNRHQ